MVRVIAWAFVGLLSATPALAETCAAPDMISSADLAPVPGGGARLLVPVAVNGAAQHFLLDTGSGGTSITEAALEALKLRPRFSENARLLDAKGNASDHYVRTDSFELGDVEIDRLALVVTPDPDAGKDPPFDGILAADLMDRWDVEMDFAAQRLNFFTPSDCAGPPWTGPSTGIVPITAKSRSDAIGRTGPVVKHIAMFGVPGQKDSAVTTDPSFQFNGPHVSGIDIRTRVLLDGKPFTANIDTGSENSTLNSDTARAVFDVTADSPGSSPLGSVSTNSDRKTGASETVIVNGERIFEHTFHTLSFGDVTITDPHFTVEPQMMGAHDSDNTVVAGSRTDRADDNLAPDVTIGMNVLRRLHLYFAFKENRIYVTANAQPGQTVLAAPVPR